jgi:hypothetical protein
MGGGAGSLFGIFAVALRLLRAGRHRDWACEERERACEVLSTHRVINKEIEVVGLLSCRGRRARGNQSGYLRVGRGHFAFRSDMCFHVAAAASTMGTAGEGEGGARERASERERSKVPNSRYVTMCTHQVLLACDSISFLKTPVKWHPCDPGPES